MRQLFFVAFPFFFFRGSPFKHRRETEYKNSCDMCVRKRERERDERRENKTTKKRQRSFFFFFFTLFFNRQKSPSLFFLFFSREQPRVEPVLLQVQQVVVKVADAVDEPAGDSLREELGALLPSGASEEESRRGRGRGRRRRRRRRGDSLPPPASRSFTVVALPEPQAEHVPCFRVRLALGEGGQRAVVY